MNRRFVDYRLGDWFLLPPDIRQWLPEGHLARFIDEVVDMLDLSAFILRYQHRTTRGRPPFHPAMMVKILLYSYATGRFSSRKIEAGLGDDLGLRYLAGGLMPDHSSLASFRERHAPEMKVLFVLVLRLCQEMGLLQLGLIAVDGTKMAANASKAQNIHPDKLDELVDAQEAIVNELMEKARGADDQDPADPTRLPRELQTATARLNKLKEARAAVTRKRVERESRAAEQAEFELAERQVHYNQRKAALEEVAGPTPNSSSRPLAELRELMGLSRLQLAEKAGMTTRRLSELERMRRSPTSEELAKLAEALGCSPVDILVKERRPPGRPLKEPAVRKVECAEVSRVNRTDADSTLLKPSNSSSYVQGYNCQVATDAGQFILAAWLSVSGRDAQNLGPTIEHIINNTGQQPSTVMADASYFSVRNASGEGILQGIELLIPPEKVPRCPVVSAPETRAMRDKLADPSVRAVYNKRSVMVEPVFGHLRANLGFVRFSMRGLVKCSGEWSLLAATHNLAKLFRLR